MGKNKLKQNLKGFSLFEIIITLSIMMILSLIVFPVDVNKTRESKLESYAYQLVTDIYYQQQRCTFKNIPGGVFFENNAYTLFDGDTLPTSTDTDLKKYPKNIHIISIVLTSPNQIFFLPGEFKPTSYGTLIVTDGTNSVRVYINREGLIGYEKL